MQEALNQIKSNFICIAQNQNLRIVSLGIEQAIALLVLDSFCMSWYETGAYRIITLNYRDLHNLSILSDELINSN